MDLSEVSFAKAVFEQRIQLRRAKALEAGAACAASGRLDGQLEEWGWGFGAEVWMDSWLFGLFLWAVWRGLAWLGWTMFDVFVAVWVGGAFLGLV